MTKQDATQQHFATFMLVLLVILASIERIYGIDRQSLWSDELFAVIASYKYSFAPVWHLMLGDSHPPGYVTFMYWTLPLTGYSDFGIRLHALLFGIMWIPLVFWLGRRWFSANTGLLAATVVTSAYTAVYYSQEARAYTMLVAFNLINLICFFEILFTENKQRNFVIGFIAASVAMLYLHYTGFVFLCAEILLYSLLWLLHCRRGSLREAAIIFGIPLLLYLPWLGEMYANMTDSPRDWSVSKAPTLDEVCNTLQRLLGPDNSHKKFHMAAVSLALLCTLVDHVKHGMSRRLSVTYSLFFLMVVPVFAFYIESLIATPIFEKRYFLTVVVIEAVLVARVICHVLGIIFKKWKTAAVVLAMYVFSVWTINSNVVFGLYSLQDKDPIREAVALVRNDLGGNYSSNNYTVLMSHDWFEHYLTVNAIAYDKNWNYRHFYVPQQIANVDEYLTDHKEIEYFYYLALREPNAEAALVAMKQQYKLLEKSEVSIEQGTIDVFKFSTKELPGEEQLKNIGTNPSNEIAKLVAQDAAGKDPATYKVLFTHDWVLPYLRRNGVKVDIKSSIGSYVVNAQADDISRYVHEHPEVDTLYYLALQEPNAEGAIFMLQSRYLLANEQAVQTSVGKMNVLTFNVKAAPVDAPSLHLRREASRANELALVLAKDVQQAPPASYAVIMSHNWFEPYFKQNGVYVDEQWASRFFNNPLQEAALFSYLSTHPEMKHLYYVALLEPGLQPLLDLLKSRMALECEQSIEVAAGRVSLMRFDVKAAGNSTVDKPPACGD